MLRLHRSPCPALSLGRGADWRAALVIGTAWLTLHAGGLLFAATVKCEVAEFRLRLPNEIGKVTIRLAPDKTRLDHMVQNLAVIYEPATQKITGLELREHTRWEYTWPVVFAAVKANGTYPKRLADMGLETVVEPSRPTGTDVGPTPPPDSATPPPPVSLPAPRPGEWRATGEKKKIQGFSCEKWQVNEGELGRTEAWCTSAIPKLQNMMEQVQFPIESVEVAAQRPLLPLLVFRAFAKLGKAGVTPIEISWGIVGRKEPARLTLLSLQDKEVSTKLFAPSIIYRPVKLVAIDGLTPETKIPEKQLPERKK